MSGRHTTAERRHYNSRAIARKLYIAKDVYREKEYENPERTWIVLRQPNRLNKGKVHCSCPLCSFHGTPLQDKKILARCKDDDFYGLPIRHRNRISVKMGKDVW